MKRYRIVVAPLAYEHLRETAAYIRDTLQARDTALRWLDRMENAIDTLSEMPLRNKAIPEEPWHSEGVRRMLEGGFFIYYWVNKDAGSVHILAVIYARRDQLPLLREMEIPEHS